MAAPLHTERPGACSDCTQPLPIPRRVNVKRCRNCQREYNNYRSKLNRVRREQKILAGGTWPICKVPDCNKPTKRYYLGNSYCSGHDMQIKSGRPLAPLHEYIQYNGQTCSIGWCTNTAYSNHLCKAHYNRSRRGADMEKPMRPTVSAARRKRMELEETIRTLQADLHNTRMELEKAQAANARLATASSHNHFPDIAPAKKMKRTCLTCSKPFMSEGAGNRMCPPCRAQGTQSSPYESL